MLQRASLPKRSISRSCALSLFGRLHAVLNKVYTAVDAKLSALRLRLRFIRAMSKHVGIVACSAEGAALCYRTLCEEGAQLLGPHDHPEVSLHTYPLAEYMRHIDRGDWEGVGALMLSSAQKLASIGADFLICPDNTIHQAFGHVQLRLPLPWLHIAEVVAARAAERGFRRLGLTGTRYLVESDVYPEKLRAHGIEYLRPNPAEREEINRLIFEELVCGAFTSRAVGYLQGVIARMKEEGADAIVLGCTEIPLIIDDANSPLPTLDSTRLLARAALQRALKSDIS
jgi:aspartate racemase